MTRQIPVSVVCGIHTGNDYPNSWELFCDVQEYLLAVEPHVQIGFAIKKLAPGLPSQARENIVMAQKLGVNKNTVENWRADAGTNCKIPLRVMLLVAREYRGQPDALCAFLRDFSAFTGEDHTQHFDWCDRTNGAV